MLIDNINLNHLRIFECVFRTNSMTKAADELHMTQSGVSQHIKVLEEILKVSLFDRIKQRLVPTQIARDLFDECSKSLYSIEDMLSRITKVDGELKGTIRIGLPTEFGNSLILPYLTEFAHGNKLIKYQITYGYGAEINEALLRGEIDFAFIDELAFDSQIEVTKVYDERVILCCSPEYMNAKGPLVEERKFFQSLDYVCYLEDGPVVKKWFSHHYKLSHMDLNIRASIQNVQGLGQLIKRGLGVGALPEHHLNSLEKSGTELVRFEGSGVTLYNSVSLAQVKGRSLTPSVHALIDFLKSSLEGSSIVH